MMENPFADLPLAADIEDERLVAELVLETLMDSDAGFSELAEYDGPLPTLSAETSSRGLFGSFLSQRRRPWQHSGQTYGFIAPGATEIVAASTIEGDRQLLNRPLRVRLERLFAQEYPGRGEKRVLVSCSAHHFSSEGSEPTQFTQAYTLRDGSSAGVAGFPLFLNLVPGRDGLAFRAATTLADNEGDRALLTMLDSPLFRQGLDLAGAVTPALRMVCQCANTFFRGAAERNKSRTIQSFDLGLGFDTTPMTNKLRVGTYIAAQVPENPQPKWSDFVLDSGTNAIAPKVPTEGMGHLFPYNYLAFSIEAVE